MEEIYANVDSNKSVCDIPITNSIGSRSSKKTLYLGLLISLGLLNVFLLIGLISLGVYSHGLGSLTADFSDIKDNLTDHLQASNDQLILMTEQRDLMKSNLTEMSKELIRLQNLSKQRWSMSSCSCYLLSTTTGSWDKGREDCRNRGGDLVVIDNPEEQRFISTFANKDAWIGLNDKETEGSWKWVDGTSLTLANWKQNQPDNGGGDPQWGEEDCAHLIKEWKSSWNDRLCTISLFWICEKGATPSG
ncbi:CD209 antigen-like protein C isoform 2-T2 [Fundulus diaphanus]